MKNLSLAILLLCYLVPSAVLAKNQRTPLVIGNAAYDESLLENPRRDATAINIATPGQPAYSRTEAQDQDTLLWPSIENSNNIGDFISYLDTYPEGTYASTAKRKTKSIETLTGENSTCKDMTLKAFR
jgi:hypothetical protein